MLSKTCPYIKIDSSQKRYNLPYAGKCNNLPCENLIVFMTDFNTMTIDRPQIYISGLLHGDEVIGATTLTELAIYFCKNSQKEPWVEELLKRRLFVFTPFTNAYGYANGHREDFIEYNDNKVSTFDPNRDFPYFQGNNNSTDSCMTTITARTVNELFREHLFIQAITFHGGLNAIGYPWGNYVHLESTRKSKNCPDYTAGRNIALVLQTYSSSIYNLQTGISDYSVGDMIEMVI
jgi:hypothetical protein